MTTDPSIMSTKDKIDLSIKAVTCGFFIVSVIFAGVVAIIGLATYTEEQEKETELRRREVIQREQEYTVRFYESQVSVFMELAEILSKMTQKTSLGNPDVDYTRFMELYYGKALLFEDTAIFDAMNVYYKALYDMRYKASPFDKYLLKVLGGKIVMACHKSLRAKFPALSESPENGLRPLKDISITPDPDEVSQGARPAIIGQLPEGK